MQKKQSVLVVNGPNLNLLGTREPEVYGDQTLQDVDQLCEKVGARLGLDVECQQSNSEGELIDLIQGARNTKHALIVNLAGLTHSSVSLRDALSASDLPTFEVHISNIHAREDFRHHSYISGVAIGVICGFGIRGYEFALQATADYLAASKA